MGSASRAVSCLCCPFRCLACGLFSCLCSILVSLLVTLGVLALALYFVFRPHTIAATVDSASLATFSLSPSPAASPSSSSSFAYNLSVAMTVRNPNKRVGLYYDGVEALAFYKAQRFGYDPLGSFYQGTRASTRLTPEFHGQQPLLQDADDDDDFSKEQSGGTFVAINVGLNANLRVKVWSFKVPGPKAKITCKLLVPAPGATNGATFQPTDCKVRSF